MFCAATLSLVFWSGLVAGQKPVTFTIRDPKFELHIRPILRVYCLDCHGGEEKLQGGLDLRLVHLMRKGGKNGPALAGKPAESLLLERMKSGEMPPGEKKVPPAQIELIEKWIANGAPTIRKEPDKLDPGLQITEEDRNWWPYQPLVRRPLPTTVEADRVRTPIDALVVESQRFRAVGFAPDADKHTLIRRVALDLTGLSPTRQEVELFLQDASTNAYEKMVDRFLASPAYGERWARHWLDVFGYADSDGDGTNDTARPYSYKFRDYVIRSVEADKPLDRMFLEMLAGDEMVPRPLKDPTPAQAELLAATLFLRSGPDTTATGGESALASDQVMADSLKIVSSSLLGLTVGCAQCHDHKYDPIPHVDYFRLRAIFATAWNPTAWKSPGSRQVSLMTEAQRQERARVEAREKELVTARDKKANEWIAKVFDDEIAKFPEKERQPLRDAFKAPADKRTPDQKKLVENNPKLNISAGVLYQFNQKAVDELKKIDDELAAVRAKKPVEDFVACLVEEPGAKVATRLNHRGDPRQPKGATLEPADLTIAYPEGQRKLLVPEKTAAGTSGYRTAWAKALFSGTHPLVGRVLANRIWLNHFGKGLVETPGDFGKLGNMVAIPALLDHLALELADKGWSQKALHRQIMTSTVYRQASRATPEGLKKDPGNFYYTRFPIHRLEAEAIRDRVLATSGGLDSTRFGPAVVTEEDTTGLVNAKSGRRSIYLQVRRSRPETMLASFDSPVLAPNCDKRVSSNAPTQALVLMNGDFIRAQATQLAKRLRAEANANTQAIQFAKPFQALQIVPDSSWKFGYAALDSAGMPLAFHSLQHWTGGQWQGGTQLPDPKIGWVLWNAQGGHPGNKDHAAVRRFVAPADGTLEIQGSLKHSSASGDGVRGRVILPGPNSGQRAKGGEWTARNSSLATTVRGIRVRKGETVDFVVDCLESETSDGFEWPVTLTLAGGEGTRRIESSKEFSGPPGPHLAAQAAHAIELVHGRPPREGELALLVDYMRAQADQLKNRVPQPQLEETVVSLLCQQLLSTNEFLYVD